jgi:hypothetical protein
MWPYSPNIEQSMNAAGWSTAEARLLAAYGARWLVTATRGGQDIRGEAEAQTEAWRAVAETAAELVEW